MSNANLYQSIQDSFSKNPLPDALRVQDGARYSSQDLDNWSAAISAGLTSCGANTGDRVVVQVEKSAAAVALYLACLRAGLTLVPLNTAYTAAELDYFISDAQPTVIICDRGRISEITGLAVASNSAVIALDDIDGGLLWLSQRLPADRSICHREPGDLAAILYTSGTTGRSKGAMLSHANLTSNANTLVNTWDMQPSDVLLHALPIFHVHGLFIALNTAFLGSARIVILLKFTVEDVLRALPKTSIMMGVPTFYSRLLASDRFSDNHYQHMRLFISGSAPLTTRTFDEFEQRTGHRILERYGMSETGIISSNPLHGIRIAGSVGFPLAAVQLRICDDSGQEIAPGETGSIEIIGPNVFSGYWQMPEKTAQEFREDGWFITGDLGFLDDEGRLFIIGRSKDMIISGGYNVYPKEVESSLEKLSGIVECAVIGVPHPDYGEGVLAVCVGDGERHQEEILALLSGQLAAYKRPKALIFIDHLPLNTMGKVQKNVLRDIHQHYFTRA